MTSEPAQSVVVFWSWQSDSPGRENRDFIQDCLERAAKKVGIETARLIPVDRDTKGVGGSPVIAETILQKIRGCDVFVWDATLVYFKPRPAPNPNVLVELGYASAVLGDGRLVGVMNTARGSDPKSLPFDLVHRRWPLVYKYRSSRLKRFWEKVRARDRNAPDTARLATREALVTQLTAAIHSALKEPKRPAHLSDTDLPVAQRLWKLLDSKWMQEWLDWRSSHPQFEREDRLDRISEYLRLAERPENRFDDGLTRERHDALVEALKTYRAASAHEMTRQGMEGWYVIRAKANTKWRDSYDAEYDHQLETLDAAMKGVSESWAAYITHLRLRHPAVIT